MEEVSETSGQPTANNATMKPFFHLEVVFERCSIAYPLKNFVLTVFEMGSRDENML